MVLDGRKRPCGPVGRVPEHCRRLSRRRRVLPADANSGVLADSPAATTSYAPGSRQRAGSWKDKNGNLWLMAGSGVDSSGSAGFLNDLWEYQLTKFKLGLSSTSTTIQSGGQGTFTLTITPQNGFSSAVSFACSGQPSGASCDFGQNPVTPSGGTAATTTLTYHAQTLSAALRPNSRPFLPGTVLALCCASWAGESGAGCTCFCCWR